MSKNRAKIEQLKELVEALGIALSAAKATSDRYESTVQDFEQRALSKSDTARWPWADPWVWAGPRK
jgi:ribosomal protein L7/L12